MATVTSKPYDYSLVRLIRHLADPAAHDSPEATYSREVLEHEFRRPSRGVFLPSLRPKGSGLDATTQTGGGYLSAPSVSADIVTSLRANSVLVRAGARLFSGLTLGFSLVVQKSGVAAVWCAENPGVDVAQTDSIFESRVFKPRTIQSTISVTRQLLQQSSPDLEQHLRNDMGAALAVAVDKAGICGSGEQNEPAGILATQGAGTKVLGTDGGNLSGVDVVAMESMVASANTDVSGWIAHPSLRGKLRQTPRFASGTVMPIWSDDGLVLGKPGFVTTSVPSGLTKGASNDITPLIAGDFANVAIALWSIEITVDKITSKKRNAVDVTLFTAADVGLLRPACFAVCPDSRP